MLYGYKPRELAKWVCGVGKVSKDPEQKTAGRE